MIEYAAHHAFLFVALVIVFIVLAGAYGLLRLFVDNTQCPRIIRGYNCHGAACDHSPGAVARAKGEMEGLYYGD